MPWAASTRRTAASHASSEPRDLVGEVDVAGGVDHVEDVGARLGALGVVRRDGPREAYGLRLDRDAALALDVHPVEVLRARRPLVDDAGELEHAVSEGRLAVVDVRDDAEVADDRRVGRARLRRVLEAHGLLSASTLAGSGQSPTRVVAHRTDDAAPVDDRGCGHTASTRAADREQRTTQRHPQPREQTGEERNTAPQRERTKRPLSPPGAPPAHPPPHPPKSKNPPPPPIPGR